MMADVRTTIHFPRSRRWKCVSHDDVKDGTYGIPNQIRRAILDNLLEKRSCYRYSCESRTIGRVELNVRKTRRAPSQLWTNGPGRVFLALSRKAQVEPASFGGADYTHGLARELFRFVPYRSVGRSSLLANGWGEGSAIILG